MPTEKSFKRDSIDPLHITSEENECIEDNSVTKNTLFTRQQIIRKQNLIGFDSNISDEPIEFTQISDDIEDEAK